MRIRWNRAVFEAIRRDPAIAADVDARAGRIAAAAGEGYLASPHEGRTRHRASVITATAEAMVDNARNDTLLGALDAGR